MPPEIQTQISSENEEKAMRMAEIERKRVELRRRMEEASKARRAKKSFMTPERKKKLRLLIRRKAAEELKKEQERKAEERRWTIQERCGDPEDTEWASKEDLIDICEYYYQRIWEIESEKWDIELEIRRKHFEIIDINSKVNDLRGKFQRPILKKVSKYENKFAILQRKAAEFNFRNQLKLVRRHEYILKDDDRRHNVNAWSRPSSRASFTSKFEEKHEEQSVADEDTAIADGDTIYEGDSVTDGEDRLGVLEEELLESPAPVLEREHHLEDDELISENQSPKEPSETLIDSESRLDGAVTEQEQHIESEETKDGELRLEGVGEDRELRLEGVVGEDRELRLEGVVDEDRELRFEKVVHEEGELRIEEGGEHGESRLEGDAADDRELRLEGADFQDEEYPEPPETPPHQHTEEDLWLYLKDCVSSVRPATVEEFVQNFIGTLQHVPEEFLKPVIDANIKRANSPSVSDGEHPTTPEGVRPEEGVLEESSSARNQEENSESLGAEFQTPVQEVSSDFPEVSTAVKATE